MAEKLSKRLDMHARDCVRAADMDTDAVLSKHQIDDMADALHEAAELARRFEEAPVRNVVGLIGQRVRLVPEPPEVG